MQRGNVREVKVVAWRGSADLCALASANCLAYFEAGDRDYEPGESVDVFEL